MQPVKNLSGISRSFSSPQISQFKKSQAKSLEITIDQLNNQLEIHDNRMSAQHRINRFSEIEILKMVASRYHLQPGVKLDAADVSIIVLLVQKNLHERNERYESRPYDRTFSALAINFNLLEVLNIPEGDPLFNFGKPYRE